MKRLMCTILTISFVIGLCACGTAKDANARPTYTVNENGEGVIECAEEAFAYDKKEMNKSIDDYIGENIVIDLGKSEAGEDNFIAYAKDVILIEQYDAYNEVLSMDEEAGVYVLANPSEEVMQLTVGEVFLLAPGSVGAPDGIAAKIGAIRDNGDGTVTIESTAAEMGELFEYIFVESMVDASTVSYDESQLEEGMEIIIPDSTQGANNAVIEPARDDTFKIYKVGSVKTDIVLKWSFGYDLSAYANAESRAKGFSNKYNYGTEIHITSINVRMYYRKETGYFYGDVSFDYSKKEENSLQFAGTWSNGENGMGEIWPGLVGFIPGTPLIWKIEPFQLIEASGTINGKIGYTESRQIGFCLERSEAGDVFGSSYNKILGNSSDSSVELEGKVESSLGIRASVGVKKVVNLFMDGAVGVRLNGKIDVLEAQDESDAGSIHDCRKCLDGDIAVFVKGNVGLNFEILELLSDKGVVLRFVTNEASTKIGDFYASYRDEAEQKATCGIGECPYKRYKVSVAVQQPDGKPAAGANVSATYPDQRKDAATANEDGIAILYLPDGDNLLYGKKTGMTGSSRVIVDGKPTEAVLKLEETDTVLIMINTDENRHEPCAELEEGLKKLYPEAVIGYYSEDGRSVLLDKNVWITEYELAQGDIVLDVYESIPANNTALYTDDCAACTEVGGIHGTPYCSYAINFNRIIKMNYPEEQLEMKMYSAVWISFHINGPSYAWSRWSGELPSGRDCPTFNKEYSEEWASMNLYFETGTYNELFEEDYEEGYKYVYYSTNPEFGVYADAYEAVCDINNIGTCLTDTALGQIDIVMQLMFEDKDAKGYIPVLPYPVEYMLGEIEGLGDIVIGE